MRALDKELLSKNIDEIAEYDLENNKLFGSCYAVVQNDETVYKNCFGFADMDKKPINGRTIFRLASMTKPITAIATLILVNRGLLSLDDQVSAFIPGYKNVRITKVENNKLVDLGESKNPVTIRHLLTHSSGIGSDSDKSVFLCAEDKKTAMNLAKFYAKVGLDFEPGTSQYYSGVGSFAVLGYIIEKIIGRNLEEFYRQEIFEPCDMTDTTFIPTEEQWSRVIEMHGKNENGNTAVEMEKGCAFIDYPCEHCVAGAGLFSTLDDYVKFGKMLLNKGKTAKKIIVKEEIFNEMISPQVEIDSTTYWGFGVRVIKGEHPFLPKGSYGWSGAYGSHFWVNPADGVVAVFMKNSTVDGGAANESSRNFESAVNRAFVNI